MEVNNSGYIITEITDDLTISKNNYLCQWI